MRLLFSTKTSRWFGAQLLALFYIGFLVLGLLGGLFGGAHHWFDFGSGIAFTGFPSTLLLYWLHGSPWVIGVLAALLGIVQWAVVGFLIGLSVDLFPPRMKER
ncbi:MAG: hypothetical protein L6R28_08970 [Planctomycetes bacterium]|nr:hypothetical protein [Planctomycetota bacterium]